MKEKEFYKMLAEIHNEVADMADGCMGSGYTPERIERDDKHHQERTDEKETDEVKRRLDGMNVCKYIPSEKPLDYIGNILRRYLKIEV